MNDNMSGAELLAQIKPRLREKGTGICLRPDLLDEWEEANTALAEADGAQEPGQRLAGGAPKASVRKLAEKVQQIEDDIAANEIRFVFRAMPKHQWQTLCDQHPPRPGNQLDAFAGYDRDAVIDRAVRLCLVSPVFTDCGNDSCDHTSCGSWQQLEAVCNPSEWAELRHTVEEVNGAVKSAPKSPLASRILESGGRGSKQPKRGA